MQYEQGALDALWNILKDKRNNFAGEYVGLKPVAFSMELAQFERAHQKKVVEFGTGDETLVLTDLEAAVKKLAVADIKFHHLTCAADAGLGDNAALCVHYCIPNERKYYVLAIPGINYVPTQETLNNLQLVFGREEERPLRSRRSKI